MIKPIFRTRAYDNSSSQNKSIWKYSGYFYRYQSYEKPQQQIFLFPGTFNFLSKPLGYHTISIFTIEAAVFV